MQKQLGIVTKELEISSNDLRMKVTQVECLENDNEKLNSQTKEDLEFRTAMQERVIFLEKELQNIKAGLIFGTENNGIGSSVSSVCKSDQSDNIDFSSLNKDRPCGASNKHNEDGMVGISVPGME